VKNGGFEANPDGWIKELMRLRKRREKIMRLKVLDEGVLTLLGTEFEEVNAAGAGGKCAEVGRFVDSLAQIGNSDIDCALAGFVDFGENVKFETSEVG
jgi:hypothetical protein